MEDQVTDIQNQDQTVNQNLGWRAGLPDDYKEHEWAKSFTKVGDFYADAVKVKDERDSLNTKLETAIFKPGENATEEEIATYKKALGVPDSPDVYEFPKGEGVEHDEAMINWAKDIFHKADLRPDQAALISQSWDGFIKGLEDAQEEIRVNESKASEEALKKEWGAKYDENLEFTKRGWNKFTDTDFDKFCDESGIGNRTPLIKFIHKSGMLLGEDFSPSGQQNTSVKASPGQLSYPNSPRPPDK